MITNLKRSCNRIVKHCYGIVGFFLMLFFYGKFHLHVMSNFPVFCEIEGFIASVSFVSFDAIIFILSLKIANFILTNSVKGYYINLVKKYILCFACYFFVAFYVRNIEFIWYGIVSAGVIGIIVPLLTLLFKKLNDKNRGRMILSASLFIIFTAFIVIVMSKGITSIALAYVQLFFERMFVVIIGTCLGVCTLDELADKKSKNHYRDEHLFLWAMLCLTAIGLYIAHVLYIRQALLLTTGYIQMVCSIVLAVSLSMLLSELFEITENRIVINSYMVACRMGLLIVAFGLFYATKMLSGIEIANPWNNHVRNLLLLGSTFGTALAVFLVILLLYEVIPNSKKYYEIVSVCCSNLHKSISDLFASIKHICERINRSDKCSIKNNKIFIIFKHIIVSFLIVIAFTYAGKLGDFTVKAPVTDRAELLSITENSVILKFFCGLLPISGKNVDVSAFLIIAIAAGLFYLNKKTSEFKHTWLSRLMCIFFAINQVLATAMIKYWNLNSIFQNGYQIVLSLVCVIGYYFATELICKIILVYVFPKIVVKNDLNEKKLLIGSAIMMFLGYIPYQIMCFPGLLVFDAAYGVINFLSEEVINTHHPVVSNWFFSYVFKIGQTIGNISVVAFIFITIQTLFTIGIFVCVIKYLYESGCSKAVIYAVICFYSFTPELAIFMQSIGKDTVFASLFTLFILKFAKAITGEELSNKKICSLLFVALLACLFRYNGFYAIVPALFILGICNINKKTGIKLLIGTCLLVFIYKGVDNYSINKLGYQKKSIIDTISICLQTTANYVRKYPMDITEEERESIENIIDFEWFDYYKGYSSDEVKTGCIFKAASDADYKNYLKTWARMGLRHPGAYFEAFYANSCGYYAIHGNDMYYLHSQYDTNNLQKGWIDEVLGTEIKYDNTTARWIAYYYAVLFERLPGIGVIASPGFCTWVLITVLCMMIRGLHERKLKGLEYKSKRVCILMFLPYLLLIATCCVSPVNSHIRYFLGIVMATPIALGVYAKGISD